MGAIHNLFTLYFSLVVCDEWIKVFLKNVLFVCCSHHLHRPFLKTKELDQQLQCSLRSCGTLWNSQELCGALCGPWNSAELRGALHGALDVIDDVTGAQGNSRFTPKLWNSVKLSGALWSALQSLELHGVLRGALRGASDVIDDVTGGARRLKEPLRLSLKVLLLLAIVIGCKASFPLGTTYFHDFRRWLNSNECRCFCNTTLKSF